MTARAGAATRAEAPRTTTRAEARRAPSPGQPRGRRPGRTGTKDAILEAARESFAEHGFEAATVRDIAQRAGVDPAMIHHYFGSKEKLFVAVVDAPIDPSEVLATPEPVTGDRLGEHLVRSLLRVWDSPRGSAGLALLRSAMSSSRGAVLLREFVLARAIRPVVAQVEPDPAQAAWRASLVASQLAGLAMARYVLRVEPLASATHDEVAAAVGPQVQHYLTGEVPPAPVG